MKIVTDFFYYNMHLNPTFHQTERGAPDKSNACDTHATKGINTI